MTPKKIVIAYMSDGSCVTSEVRGSAKGWEAVDRLATEVVHKASMIVVVDSETGRPEVLKNRWGPAPDNRTSNSTSSRYAPPASVRDKGYLVIQLIKALEAGNYNATPSELVQGCSYPAAPVNSVKPSGVCRCDIKDLFSTGHSAGCPEKR